MLQFLRRYFPVFDWGRTYTQTAFSNDLIAAVIVTIMLIPQSLAYALLAGLPPEAGIYASIAPIMLYAVFGTNIRCRTLVSTGSARPALPRRQLRVSPSIHRKAAGQR